MDAPLIPPPSYGQVAPSIFRCSMPSPEHFAFLASLKIRSIVLLSPELMERRLRDFVERSSITVYDVALQQWLPDESWKPLHSDVCKLALEFVLNVNNHPTLIMCTSGVHLTGALVGCLRRLQGWSVTTVIDEYRMYSRGRTRFAVEQFLELFDTDLVYIDPVTQPSWLSQHRALCDKEESELYAMIGKGEHAVFSMQHRETVYPEKNVFDLYYYDAAPPLTSARTKFSAKKSVIDDDED